MLQGGRGNQRREGPHAGVGEGLKDLYSGPFSEVSPAGWRGLEVTVTLSSQGTAQGGRGLCVPHVTSCHALHKRDFLQVLFMTASLHVHVLSVRRVLRARWKTSFRYKKKSEHWGPGGREGKGSLTGREPLLRVMKCSGCRQSGVRTADSAVTMAPQHSGYRTLCLRSAYSETVKAVNFTLCVFYHSRGITEKKETKERGNPGAAGGLCEP